MVLLPGTQYSNGQAFDIPNVVIEAHKVGAYAGFDLAAVVGDMELSLHDWNVDFAVWAHYKYLNGGLGSVGGAFIHRNILRTLIEFLESDRKFHPIETSFRNFILKIHFNKTPQ